MSSCANFRVSIVMLAIVAMINPCLQLQAAPPVPKEAARTVPDVRLDEQRAFHGVVVDSQGQPCGETRISLIRIDTTRPTPKALETVTDERGRFHFRELSAGTHRIETSAGVYLCRLWTPDAAPPAAAPALLVVNDTHIARGQRPIHDIFYTDPLLMATVVAAAIAIPIAVHKNRDDSPEGS